MSPEASEWTEDVPRKINNALIEFIDHRKYAKRADLAALTLRGYFVSIQRGMLTEWQYRFNSISGSIFADPVNGEVTVQQH